MAKCVSNETEYPMKWNSAIWEEPLCWGLEWTMCLDGIFLTKIKRAKYLKTKFQLQEFSLRFFAIPAYSILGDS